MDRTERLRQRAAGMAAWISGVLMALGATTATAQWTRHELPQLENTEFTVMTLHDGYVYGGTSGGRVFRTPAGQAEFEEWGQGLNTSSVSLLHVVGSVMYAATDDGLYYRNISAPAWQWIDRSDTLQSIRGMASIGDTLILAAFGRNIYLLTGPSEPLIYVNVPDSLRPLKDVDVHDHIIYLATEVGLWRSTDRLATLQEIEIDTGVTEAGMVYLTADGSILTHVYTRVGKDYNLIHIPGAEKFNQLPILQQRVLRHRAIDDRFGTIVIADGEDVYRSIDRGLYWERLDAGFEMEDLDLSVVCIGHGLVFASARPNEVWTRPESHLIVNVSNAPPSPLPYDVRWQGTTLQITVQGAEHTSPTALVYDVGGRLLRQVELVSGVNAVLDVPFPSFVQVMP